MHSRRKFILWSSMMGTAFAMDSTPQSGQLMQRLNKVIDTIVSVQWHMFPLSSTDIDVWKYRYRLFIEKTLFETHFDADIRAFIIEGAEKLIAMQDKSFHLLSRLQKEDVLRKYEKSRYGSAWLSRILTLTMEAAFSDSVYGCNYTEEMWKFIESYGGYPRPKSEYLQNV